MGGPAVQKGQRAVLAAVSSSAASSAPVSGDASVARTAAAAPASSTGSTGFRLALPSDAQFLTVEPDGRDDVTFRDRLLHALKTVFSAVQRPDEAKAAAERALLAAEEAIEAAEAGGEDYFVQLRVVGVEVAYADNAADGDNAYASYRRLGLEIGVARGGTVRADDATVVSLDGSAIELSAAQVRTGLASGVYRRTETAPTAGSGKADSRLADARAGLARVKAIQDALKAYRSGDIDPLKRLLTDGDSQSSGRSAAVFPGIGTLAFN